MRWLRGVICWFVSHDLSFQKSGEPFRYSPGGSLQQEGFWVCHRCEYVRDGLEYVTEEVA